MAMGGGMGGGNQEAMMQGQQIQEQLQAVQSQKEQIGAFIQNLETGLSTLEALQDVEEGEDVMLPVGGGVHVSASMGDPGETLVNVGSDVHIEGSLEEAIEHVEERLANVRQAHDQLEERSQQLQEQLQQLASQLQQGRGRPPQQE